MSEVILIDEFALLAMSIFVLFIGMYLTRRIPLLADIPYPVQMEPNLVVEFYSR